MGAKAMNFIKIERRLSSTLVGAQLLYVIYHIKGLLIAIDIHKQISGFDIQTCTTW